MKQTLSTARLCCYQPLLIILPVLRLLLQLSLLSRCFLLSSLLFPRSSLLFALSSLLSLALLTVSRFSLFGVARYYPAVLLTSRQSCSANVRRTTQTKDSTFENLGQLASASFSLLVAAPSWLAGSGWLSVHSVAGDFASADKELDCNATMDFRFNFLDPK